MKTVVRRQDHLTGFAALAGHNRRGSEICWIYMQKNWKKIEAIYGGHDAHLIHFIEVNPKEFDLFNFLSFSFRVYQDYSSVKNEVKKFE